MTRVNRCKIQAFSFSDTRGDDGVKYIHTSDIHLGHRKTPTEHIIHAFVDTILTERNRDVDVIFIGGDLMDRALEFFSKDILLIIPFFGRLLDYCYRNNIKLRLLEGTPGHDWNQIRPLLKLNDIRGEQRADVKHFPVLDVEYMHEFEKYILYIPDEWANTNDEIYQQIDAKLQALGISQVDIAVLHGQFAYQTGGMGHALNYDESYFLNLVKGFIHIGHYHTHTTFDRIIANGSLDRLAHGEEEDKGYVRSGGYSSEQHAWICKTIRVTAKATLEKLDATIFSYPKGSYIRLIVPASHPFNITFTELKTRYLDYVLKKNLDDECETETVKTAYILPETTLHGQQYFVLDNDIPGLVTASIQSKKTLPDSELGKLIRYLDVFKEVADEQTV